MSYKPVYVPKSKAVKLSKRAKEYTDLCRRFPAASGGKDSSAGLGMK